MWYTATNTDQIFGKVKLEAYLYLSTKQKCEALSKHLFGQAEKSIQNGAVILIQKSLHNY